MSIFSGLASIVTKPVLGAANDIVKSTWGNTEARDAAAADENIAAKDQFAQEFKYTVNRTWFDVLIDGINRLPRPMIIFSVLYMFFLAYSNPEKFSIVMAALALVPEPMWSLLFLIVAFFLPSRMIEKLPAFKGVSAKQAKEVRDGVKDIIAMKEKMENKALELVDHSSNPSILAWRKKHKS
jgi:hypothetical protein